MDPIAARRWVGLALPASPWLHEEVARRMQTRLQWIRHEPQVWAHWQPLHGGLLAQRQLAQRYAGARCYLVEPHTQTQRQAARLLQRPWWSPARWRASDVHWALPPAQSVDMVWANMDLHYEPQPQALMTQWLQALKPNGFVMFSCLGPDSLRGLHALYTRLGWPPPAHPLTDMHDWGDLLVRCGFAEPVMDMERIRLRFASPARLLQELRELGRNLHPARFGALRGRAWRQQLEQTLATAPELQDEESGALVLDFEIIYGHALKPLPRVPMQVLSTVSLRDMQALVRRPAAGDSRDA